MVLLVDPDQEGLLVVVPEENQLKELNKELSGDGLSQQTLMFMQSICAVLICHTRLEFVMKTTRSSLYHGATGDIFKVAVS